MDIEEILEGIDDLLGKHEGVIDVLVGPFALSIDGPGHQKRLYGFARALAEEVIARLPGPTNPSDLLKAWREESDRAAGWKAENGTELTLFDKDALARIGSGIERAAPAWRHIARAPRDGTELLLARWFPEGGYRRLDVGHWDVVDQDSWEEGGAVYHGWVTENDSFLDGDEPTHFMLVDKPTAATTETPE